jgi:superfamily II DNA or RNA helicase
MNHHTYLGQKGYTIHKNELSIEQQKQIRNDLTIKPFVMGSPLNDQKIFPAYRESSNKFYLPHYYGVEHYGIPKEYKISEGNDIDLDFSGKLRENQEIVVNTYLDHVKKAKYGGGLLELPCAYGKCLGKNTKILMFDGTIKNVEDICINDLLMGDDSTPRKVLSLARGREQMYRIYNKKGDSYVCNESHILSLKYESNNETKNEVQVKKGDIIDISVIDFLNLPESVSGELLGYKVPVEFEEEILEFDPYVLGHWLGTEIYKSSINSPIRLNLFNCLNGNQHKIICFNDINNFNDFLKKNHLHNNKHIPHSYLCNSKNNRIQVLTGILHCAGYIHKNKKKISILISNDNSQLQDDIIYLARSLGLPCYKKPKLFCSKINIYGCGIEEITNKYSETSSNDNLVYRLKIEKLEVDDYYGFEIDGNRRFVLGDFTVTHNTVLSLNIISSLKKKTFIIVHKEFLMNQWIERINQFLPAARIGKIQGQIIDIDNKDIVIGMLQSLSMKEYPASIFESFGLTIIDEVHHISSEVFSNSLFKLVTKYMLGLSATMNRKDGTTNVFKMFLGDVIFKGKRDEPMNVIVHAIEYKVNDEEFNEEKLDYRGNPAYSSMISKLCEYNRRSEFILKVLSDLFITNPNQQIMILAHNKNLLTYLHNAIVHKNIATVGYYVGGMKEHALKETESKKVVIATYSMAAEALDIKTLTTLIMATPKTDIEQSVGRILRERHSQPIVVDIIDSHNIFQNQWKKRKTFYKKENYKIIYTNNSIYTPDTSQWTTLYNAKNVCHIKENEKVFKPLLKKQTKTSTKKSHSSTDKSITDESSDDEEEERKDKYLSGKCFLSMKK